MITRSRISQAFPRDLVLFPHAGKDTWLIKGDFDHFKLTNDLYGPLIADYLLDRTVEIITAQLAQAERRLRCGPLLFNVIGDDLTISVPPAALAASEVARLLWGIREAIRESFWQRCVVGALPLPADFFDDIPQDALAMIRSELKEIHAVLDFARRQRGYLLLLPAEKDGAAGSAFERVMRVIRRWSGKQVSPLALALDWIFNPVDAAWHTFNDGFVYPPMVSFAACPGRVGAPGSASIDESVSLACQAALRLCKQERQGVRISAEIEPAPAARLAAGALPCQHPPRPGAIHWTSERALREALYFRQLNQPLLFQFNPVYLLSQMPAGFLHVEKYRGNLYGIGLKGINELCGQHAADRVIRRWLSICSEEMRAALAAKGIAPQQLWAAQFVDRFTVCCEQPVLGLAEIAALVGRLAARFNTLSPEINVSQVRVSAVLGERAQPGCRLFHQLDLTCRSPRCALLEDAAFPAAMPAAMPAGVPVEARQNCAAALDEGQNALERESLAAARRLAALDGCVFF